MQTARPSYDQDDIHQLVVAQMRELAESIEGFVLWRDQDDGLDYWGIVIFETAAGALEWRDHPDHARINEQSRGDLYSAFRILAFEKVREASYGQS